MNSKRTDAILVDDVDRCRIMRLGLNEEAMMTIFALFLLGIVVIAACNANS